MKHTHLTDDELVASCLGEDAETTACTICAERRRALSRTLAEVTQAAAIAADEAFPPTRLARQRLRILQRIEHLGRQGRVLAFPGRAVVAPSILRPRSLRRWVASAAVAGLVVGLAAGRVVDRFPPFGPAFDPQQAAPLRASSEPLGEDDLLLRAIEAEVFRRGAAAVGVAEITPDPWEVQ